MTVDDAAGAVSAAGMQFAADGYRLEGDTIELAGADGRSVIRVGDGTAAGAGYTRDDRFESDRDVGSGEE